MKNYGTRALWSPPEMTAVGLYRQRHPQWLKAAQIYHLPVRGHQSKVGPAGPRSQCWQAVIPPGGSSGESTPCLFSAFLETAGTPCLLKTKSLWNLLVSYLLLWLRHTCLSYKDRCDCHGHFGIMQNNGLISGVFTNHGCRVSFTMRRSCIHRLWRQGSGQLWGTLLLPTTSRKSESH